VLVFVDLRNFLTKVRITWFWILRALMLSISIYC
jgi:hypothetical protein